MLKFTLIPVFAATVVAAPRSFQVVRGAQEPERTSATLSRVFGQEAQNEASPDAEPAGVPHDSWAAHLATPDLAQRERAFDALVAAARRDPALVKTLESWSADPSHAELAWTARLALRELRSSPAGWLGAQALPGGVFEFGFDPLAGEAFDPRAWIDAMEQRFAQPGLGRQIPHSAWPPSVFGGGAPTSSSSTESFSLRVAPGDVRCEVKRMVDGREETQEYTAESLEQLLEAHPELSDKVQAHSVLGQSAVDLQASPWGEFLQHAPSDFGSWPFGPARTTGEVRTDILGVVVEPLADTDSIAGVAPGTGLRIERVEPGTIAAGMGLLRGQVLIEINGSPVRSRDDISAEIRKRAPEGAVEAVVVDRFGQRVSHTWKPDSSRQL